MQLGDFLPAERRQALLSDLSLTELQTSQKSDTSHFKHLNPFDRRLAFSQKENGLGPLTIGCGPVEDRLVGLGPADRAKMDCGGADARIQSILERLSKELTIVGTGHQTSMIDWAMQYVLSGGHTARPYRVYSLLVALEIRANSNSPTPPSEMVRSASLGTWQGGMPGLVQS